MSEEFGNCGKFGKFAQKRADGTIPLSEEYDKDCNCTQCLSRRKSYLKMVVHNLAKHDGWDKEIEHHLAKIEIIEGKLVI